MELANSSPFAAERLILMNERAEEVLLVIVKATFDLKKNPPRLHDEQEPVHLADQYHGEPGKSSLKYAGEGALYKPGVDIILIGHAYAGDKKKRELDVRLQVGRLSKTVRVFGERQWENTLFTFKPGQPRRFERIPLVWERAFGGIDDSSGNGIEAEPRNPVGIGFRGKKTKKKLEDLPVPNLEYPTDLVRSSSARPVPACFSFVAPHWSPRVDYAGTYDDAWLKTRAPLLPKDFDPRFHQTAPTDQIYPGKLEPGTPVEVENASPSGKLSFGIPDVMPTVQLFRRFQKAPTFLDMRLDTVVIDGDAERLMLTLRGSTSVHNQVYDYTIIGVGRGKGL